MNKPQLIRTPAGEEMVVLARAEYEALVSATEDLEDALAAERSLARIADGTAELIPEAEVDGYLSAARLLAQKARALAGMARKTRWDHAGRASQHRKRQGRGRYRDIAGPGGGARAHH